MDEIQAVTIVAKRKIFARLSITAGNVVQLVGIFAADLALQWSRSTSSSSLAFAAMFLSWLLLYFSCHGIAHWILGRTVGIRFLYYTIGGTANPQAGHSDYAGSLNTFPSLECRQKKSRCKMPARRLKP